MTRLGTFLAFIAVLLITWSQIGLAETPKDEPTKPLIQMAILLDTSNSMDGLIDQARAQLWSVVNELARTKRHGQSPELEVALYQYGNDGLNPKENWIQLVLPFTTDLDKVSEKLFALRTNGGEEYCGAVTQAALKELQWSNSADSYKVIFIAGNEPFTQGPVDFHGPCAEALKRDIRVNTTHCGPEQVGVQTGWQEGAMVGGGAFMCIDQNQSIAVIAAPQDPEIATLSATLNDTYVPYGKAGAEGKQRQLAQDVNASAGQYAASAAPVQRAQAKSSGLYTNESWDLVDAVNKGKVKIEDVADKDLPDNLKKMKPEERKAYVEEQSKKRGEIQQKIKDLSAQRDQYVATKRREAATTQSLETAMISTVRDQMNKKQFDAAK